MNKDFIYTVHHDYIDVAGDEEDLKNLILKDVLIDICTRLKRVIHKSKRTGAIGRTVVSNGLNELNGILEDLSKIKDEDENILQPQQKFDPFADTLNSDEYQLVKHLKETSNTSTIRLIMDQMDRNGESADMTLEEKEAKATIKFQDLIKKMRLAVEKEGFHSEHGCMFPVSDIPQEYESSLKPTYYASLAKNQEY